jgi:RNA polymerase sigma factor (sigma-70 family)
MRTVTRRDEHVDADLGQLYLRDVGQFPLLSKDDEVRLARQIEDGNLARTRLSTSISLDPDQERELRRTARRGADAQQTFVQSNLRLVVSIAKRYQRAGVPMLDLIQEGNLGLMRAVEKFDWRMGFKFSTYATWWIRQAIRRGISHSGRVIRLPEHASAILTCVLDARSRLEPILHRAPTIAELAAETDLAEAKVSEALAFPTAPLSTAAPLGEESDAVLGDFIEDTTEPSPLDAALHSLMQADVAPLLDVLNERERRIISMRFGLDRRQPCTLGEVGATFNVTRERIRQIEVRAMSKLQHPSVGIEARQLLDA